MTVRTWGFISDVHMSSAAAVTGQGSYLPWSWLSRKKVDRLGAFLQSEEVKGLEKLFLVGDIIDTWIHPHDLRPPTAIEVLAAEHNGPILEGLRAFAKQGKQIYWIEGNHDAGAGTVAAQHIHPDVRYVSRIDAPPLYVRHGHEGSLFNARDPKNRPFPLGYYLSRLCATATATGLGSIGLNFQLIWDCKEKLVAFLKGSELVDEVFAAVRDEAKVDPTASFVMPDNGRVPLSDVQIRYRNLRHEWEAAGRGSWVRAVECEYDPFYGIDHEGVILYITGHSHDKFVGHLTSPESRYVNVGSWCDKEASYATIDLDANGGITPMHVQLSTWGPDIDEPSQLLPLARASATPRLAVLSTPH